MTSFGIDFQTEKVAEKASDHQVLPSCMQVYQREVWCVKWSKCCKSVIVFPEAYKKNALIFKCYFIREAYCTEQAHFTRVIQSGTHFTAESTYGAVLLLQWRQQQARPWSTIECSQPAAWTINQSLHVVSRVRAFPGWSTYSGSTIPISALLDSGVIACHLCIISHSGNCSGISRHFCAFMPFATSIPAPTIAKTSYIQAFHAQL